MNNFTAGHRCPVQFQQVLPGGSTGRGNGNVGSLSTLNVTGHNLDIEVALFDCSHTGLNGETGRISGKRDCKGQVMIDVDADLPPWLSPPTLTASTSGVMLFFYHPTNLAPFQIPVILGKEHYESSIGSEVKAAFDVSENAFAGYVVYPAN